MTKQKIIFKLYMTLLMGLIMSAIFTFNTTGMENFFSEWGSKFISIYIIIVPVVFSVAPIAEKLTALTMKKIK